MITVLKRKLVRLTQLSLIQIHLLILATVLLGMTRLVVLTIPFRWIAGYLGDPKTETPQHELTQDEKRKISTIAWSVKTASHYTIWNSNCLAQALTAKILFYQQGIASTLYLGVTNNQSDQWAAHAWLRCGNEIPIGAKGHREYTVVGTFAKSTQTR